MKLGQTSVLYTAARFISSVAGFIATVYFARVLGDTVLGQYALIFAVVGWFGVVSNAGLFKAITKRISEGEEESQYFGASLVLACTVILVGVVVVFLLGEYVNDYVGTSATIFVGFLLVINVGKVPINATLNGKHLVHVNSVLSIVGGLVTPVTQIGLVLIGWQLAGMVVGYAFSSILTALLAIYALQLRPSIPDIKHFRSLFDFARYAWLGNISNKFYGTLDITVLGIFVTSGLVGVYSVVWSIVTFLSIFGNGIQMTLFPELSKLSSEGRFDDVSQLTEQALAFSGLILIPGLIGGFILAGDLLRIYGPSFVRGEQILAILIVAAIVRTYNKQLLNALDAIDRPELAFRSNLVFIAANTVLNVGLIYLYGIIGAAIATTLSAGIGFLVSTHYAIRELAISPPLREVSKQWVAALSMGLVVVVLNRAIGSWSYFGIPELKVIVVVGLGAVVYFGLLFAVSLRFRDTVQRNLSFIL